MDNFSPNMLKTYDTCPKKYYYKYIEKINLPVSQSIFERGKKIHALAHYFLQGINISKLEASLNEEEKEIWKSLLDNIFFQKNYYNSEYMLLTKIDKYWIGGRLDAVVHDENKFYILDYKTGSVPKNPEYDFQTMVYLVALSLLLQRNDISFVYIDLKHKKNYVIEYNKSLETEYTQKLIRICKQIESDSEYNCNYENCKNCEYQKFCN